MSNEASIVQEQLDSLDDTDCLASAWADALAAAAANKSDADGRASMFVAWGGRGRGGRGLARATYQPKDVIVDNVSLHYLETTKSNAKSKSGSILEQSRLKLVHGHIYALVGHNGCGKSTLLRRMHAHKIPGLSPHLTTLYLPQHNDEEALQIVAADAAIAELTPVDVVLTYQQSTHQSSEKAVRLQIAELEDKLDSLHIEDAEAGSTDPEEQQEQLESLCEQISNLEMSLEQSAQNVLRRQAQDALQSFGIGTELLDVPFANLTSGQRKKVLLSVALVSDTDVLLLDEPSQDLDVPGLIQLRRLVQICQEQERVVVLVSHDTDLINDVATDIIYFHNRHLHYFPGNYDNFQTILSQRGIQALREQVALDKKREHMLQTIDNIKKQPVPRRGGARKKSKQVESHRKKLERAGIQRNENGHRWQVQKAGTGIQRGAINSLDASARKGMSPAQLLKQAQQTTQQPPDKAIQFVFREPSGVWGEALITAFDLGYKLQQDDATDALPSEPEQAALPTEDAVLAIKKKPGFLFDSIDLRVDEGSKICILGTNGSGKSTLLRLLAKAEAPTEGEVHHASGVTVGFWDADVLRRQVEMNGPKTSLQYLQASYPQKTEQDIRGELTAFGLGPKQVTRPIHFLSGGEQTRLALVNLMLQDPPVLIMDNPTCHLDVESVKALAYGLQRWNGTVIMVSHDASFLRSFDVQCFVLMEEQGKLARVEGGMDTYLRHYRM